jgi:hypothetical protein
LPGFLHVGDCGHANHRANDTGIEWVSCCFSSYQFGLSGSFSVSLVQDESNPDLYKTLWRDPRMTARARGFRPRRAVIR